jgi:hypothetical protein
MGEAGGVTREQRLRKLADRLKAYGDLFKLLGHLGPASECVEDAAALQDIASVYEDENRAADALVAQELKALAAKYERRGKA